MLPNKRLLLSGRKRLRRRGLFLTQLVCGGGGRSPQQKRESLDSNEHRSKHSTRGARGVDIQRLVGVPSLAASIVPMVIGVYMHQRSMRYLKAGFAPRDVAGVLNTRRDPGWYKRMKARYQPVGYRLRLAAELLASIGVLGAVLSIFRIVLR
jgi:hypothetical protein